MSQESLPGEQGDRPPPSSFEQEYGRPLVDMSGMTASQQKQQIRILTQEWAKRNRPAAEGPSNNAPIDQPQPPAISAEEVARRKKIITTWQAVFNRIVKLGENGTEDITIVQRYIYNSMRAARRTVLRDANRSSRADLRNLDSPLAKAVRLLVPSGDAGATGVAALVSYEIHLREYHVAMKGCMVRRGDTPLVLADALGAFIKDKNDAVHTSFTDASSRALKMARVVSPTDFFGVPVLAAMRFSLTSIKKMTTERFNLFVTLFTAELPNGVQELMPEWLSQQPEWKNNIIPKLNEFVLGIIPALIRLHRAQWANHFESLPQLVRETLQKDAQGRPMLFCSAGVPAAALPPMELMDAGYKNHFQKVRAGGGPRRGVFGRQEDGTERKIRFIRRGGVGAELFVDWVERRAASLQEFPLESILATRLSFTKKLHGLDGDGQPDERYKAALDELAMVPADDLDAGRRYGHDAFARVAGWCDQSGCQWDDLDPWSTFFFRLYNPAYKLTPDDMQTIGNMVKLVSDAQLASDEGGEMERLNLLKVVCCVKKDGDGVYMVYKTGLGYSRPKEMHVSTSASERSVDPDRAEEDMPLDDLPSSAIDVVGDATRSEAVPAPSSSSRAFTASSGTEAQRTTQATPATSRRTSSSPPRNRPRIEGEAMTVEEFVGSLSDDELLDGEASWFHCSVVGIFDVGGQFERLAEVNGDLSAELVDEKD